MARKKGDDISNILGKCDKLKSKHNHPPILEQIMKTYLTEDLMDTFKIKEKKRKYLKVLLAEQAKETGEKSSKVPILPLTPTIPVLNIAHEIMRKNAERCPISPMSRFFEQDVRNMIKGKNLEKKYPKIVDSIILEIRDIFITMTHNAGVDLKVKPYDGSLTRFKPAPYKYMGKTERYQIFLKRREELKSKWVLHYPLIKKVHQECVERLPEMILDVGVYHYPEVLELQELASKFSELSVGVSKILDNLRNRIILMIENDKTRIQKSHVRHYYEAITTLQALHVSNCISRILEHIVDVSGCKRRVPFMKLTIHFKGGLLLKPSSSETSCIYKDFMKQLVEVGKGYQTIERRQKQIIERFIHLNITNDYFEDVAARMRSNINNLYKPVMDYIKELDTQFSNIYRDIDKGDTISQQTEMTFESGCDLIQHYDNYFQKASNIQCAEHFSVGQLVVSEYIRTLRESLLGVMEDIFVQLCEIHELENEAIIEEFNEVTRRALQRPSSTEELIQQGKYMIEVKTVILTHLRERIQKLLSGLAKIMDYGVLTKEHMALNARTIKWLEDIEGVLEQNSAMYEGIKYEAEERVHKSIAEIKRRNKDIIPKLNIFNKMDDIKMARQYIMEMAPIMDELRDIKTQIEWTNREEACLGFALSEYPEYAALTAFVYPFYHLVKMCLNLIRKTTVWLDGQFEFLNYEETETFIEDNNKEYLKLFKLYKTKIRLAQQEKSPLTFKGISEDVDSNNWPSPLKLCSQSVLLIKEFRPAMTMMRIMCNDALLKRHWKDMSDIAGFDLTPNAGTSLRKMLHMGLEPDIDQYDVISNGATKERELLTNLTKMKAEWQEIKFKVGQYKETGLPILTALDDIQVVLDDHIIKALTMRGSVFVKPYEAEVKEFYAKLVRVNSTIEEWGKVQAQWLYLLPIFSSKDIVAQMPEEGLLFREVNDTFKKYMEAVVLEPRVIETAGSMGVLEAMQHCLELLEQINEGVSNYLERKRLFFPRFFFLSNDEMLEILSETKDPLRVQPHLKKCFEAINSLQFDEVLAIHEMISQEGERVKFKNIVSTKEAGGSVEKWLILVEDQMIISIRDQIIKSNRHYSMVPRTQWITKWQGQIVLCVSQMQWTADVHKSLNHHEGFTIPDYAASQAEQLKDTVALIRDPKLSNLNRITIKALIVIDVHAKDVVEELNKKGVSSDKEFKWLSQLRYYLEDDESLVRLINATVKYAYEYLGNSDRLVITPLTDRCYRTLIGAYHLHLNGAPEGPAGTGKTETTKDLAKALAVQCVVFNCSDGLDYKAMGKFFKGLASCGAWVCFDEFNRIDIEVLSVVAQQILSIVLAVRAKAKTFLFEGTELRLNPACYVCITMNPGYAGRSELPDNLKVLFRTVAMMVPDYAMIGEISLYSFGFIDARNLSVKIVTTYRLCSEQLSSQNHYDYGMRAVKSVLSAAGNNKRAFPNENESILLLRAILDVNLPKFLSHDLPLFSGIISDLFPGIILPQADYKLFTRTMAMCCKERNLQPKDTFVVKVIQTYEMMIVRHGFMIVGQPFAGKTSTLKILADTLTALNLKGIKEEKVQYKFLNPKAITMGQLYGEFDPISYEWFDGVVSNTYRDFTVAPEPDRKWIIFDGPVDAVWIENMNSALDDNKKLCLMSGEVMAMTSSMSLIFEVMDLEQASPATVSRCGMIFMEPTSLGWRPLLDSWLPNQSPEWCSPDKRKFIIDLFEWLVPPCLHFARKKCIMFCNPGDICLVKNTINLMQMYLDDACEKSTKKEEDFKYLRQWTEATMIMSITWGMAGILDADSRVKFDEFVKKLFSNQNTKYPVPESIGQIEVMIPQDNVLTEYAFIYKTKGAWKYYPESVKYKRVEDASNLQQVLIPTIDTSRYMSLMKLHIKNKQPFLLVGPTGTGKSFYIQDLILNKIEKELYEPGFITFTVQISCNQTQNLIISKLNKRRRGIYGPPKGKLAVLFIDDVNMPQKEVYGAQPPIELLRQFFDHKNWFDLKTTEPIYMLDVMFCAAMGLVGGSRQEIYARFLRHFSILSINEFSQESMAKIYVNILHVGWKNNGFPSDSINMVNQIVNASLEIYRNAIENLRPTPSKSHYVFNLRDFSRLILGVAMLRRESVTEETGKKIYPRIWVHEVLRIFYDRLIEETDKEWLFNRIKIIVRDFFRDSFESVFDNLPKSSTNEITQESLKGLMFGTYFDQDSAEEERKYEQASNIQAFADMAQNFLDDYNSSHKNKMDVVLFDYALEHLSKICRILTMASGSGLLVGISGSGRQSLTRLASEIFQLKLFQPEITKNYGLNEWRDDIKKVLKESGGAGRNCVFLISEEQIKEEVFLQDIDCLLNSGEVPNIYQIDEKQEILDMVRLAAQGGNRNLDISALTIFFFFTRRCREKLHILLCFSPVGSTFRNRLRLFPSLINCCTIDWFEPWPETALQEVARTWMGDVNLTEEVKSYCVVACQYFHVQASTASTEFFQNMGRKTYITSASYLELIKSFTILTNTKQQELMKARNRYLGGLEKLKHAAASISVMQTQLAELQPQLQVMSVKATEMRTQIEAETVSVEKATALVKEDEKIANRQAAAAQLLKKECEADLAEAIPILNEALSALDTLKPADITLVKSMKNPPAAVKLVLAAVCIIKDIKPDRVPEPGTGRMVLDFWGPSKRMLGDMNFLQGLKDFDKDNIKPEIIGRIRKEFLPNKDFRPEVVAKASSAAEGLCKWIIAMDKYDKVWKIVAPKKAKLDAAEKEFAETMAILTAKKNEVARLEAALAVLNEQLDVAIKKQTELQDNVDLCNAKLFRAQKLIGGLGGEKTRWTEAADNLLLKYEGLAGDILISVGIISYLSAFNAQYRQKIIVKWHKYVRDLKIPCCEEFDFISILGVDVLIQNWYIYGLPRDTFSTENGIIMANSRRWSLFIDPQSQASSWIKKMEKRNDLVVVKFSYPDYMKRIEVCIQTGTPVLIDGIEETLEAPLDPILYKKVFKQAGMEVISLGENVIEYNKNFKMYMCSKFRNPHYLPEIFNKVTIVNFALTLDGLQDQLLGIVVAVENPDLQQLKEELIVQKAENKAALLRVEENILRTLAESKGDILEDESAIKVLDESRILSVEITEKQEKSLEIEKSIEESRVKYTGVAQHSSVLYYCISDLANVDPMYQYSLEWFINLYIGSIQKAEKFRLIEKRCQSLINGFTFDLYSNITRSLFEKDKLLFSFLLCAKILIFQKKLHESDLVFLLTGGVSVENHLENPTTWLPTKSWDELCRAAEIPAFHGLIEHFTDHHNTWKKLYDHIEPQTVELAPPWNESLSNFMKLIIIRLFRPDKILIAIAQFVKNEMGEKFIMPPQFNIALSFAESYSLSPLIFILSPGTDPMSALVKFAEDRKFTERFQSISLGQGQGPRAAAMIEAAQGEGCWVCLQNCHLATSWMPTLEKIFEDIDYSNTHEFFRLWLTSYPSDKFPVTLLQKGVKMTNEPPTGLQQNLLKSYTSDPVKNPDFFNGCPGKEAMFARLLYGVAFFHAVVQERRTFGPLGWNIPYGFNDSDFDISVQQVRMFINESENPYEALSYLIGECNYGGRVTDDWDRRLIVTILEDFLSPQVANNAGYRFVKITASYYGLPKENSYEDYVNHINSMPQVHPPEAFGLHTNAGITKDLQNSNMLLNSVLKAYGESSTGGGEDVDKYLMLLTGDILGKLPNVFDIETAKTNYPVVYNESMNTVLVQEMERFNKLLLVIRASLVNLQKAIKGLVAMSPAVEAFSTSLMLSRIPSNWMGVSYPSLKNLPDYIADFIKRIDFLQKWFEEGKPKSYWVSGFFFTQAFLTGVKQNYARKYTIPIDKLTYDFEVLKDENFASAPADGAYIYGLFTDGARWNKQLRVLDELQPKVLNEAMPTIWVKPIKFDDLKQKGRYTCPVYKTSTRRGVLSTTGHSTNYVLPILLETKQNCSHWIKRSVALLCQSD